MNIKRMRNLAIETFKTINNLHHSFVKEIFTININRRIWSNKIITENHHTTISGKKYLTTIRHKVWNYLPRKHKIETQLHHLSLHSNDILTHGSFSSATASVVMIL